MDQLSIRDVQISDAGRLAEIYSYYVLNTAVSFEYYYDYYKTKRGYHVRSLNSNDGWNVTGCESFMNQPILKYSNEIRSAVLLIHGEKAHSCYFSRDAYANMIKDSKYSGNKELMIIPEASHTDLYDGGEKKVIPFDRMQSFFEEHLK